MRHGQRRVYTLRAMPDRPFVLLWYDGPGPYRDAVERAGLAAAELAQRRSAQRQADEEAQAKKAQDERDQADFDARTSARNANPDNFQFGENSKQAAVIQMLQRPEGATINQICAATGWQAHTVRGTFAGAFKKKLGLTITSEKPEGGERIYRVS